MNSPSHDPKKLISVRGKLLRATLHFEPCQPVEGPITKGPLIARGAPLQRATLHFHPVEKPTLVLKFGIEEGSQPDVVFARVGRIIALVKDYGFVWDRANSNGEAGQITVQFVPTTEEAAGRLAWLKETLTPVLADIREVTKPEWSEIPAWV